MKYIYLNLKRFDIPVRMGGVNRIAPIEEWGAYIIKSTQDALAAYNPDEAEFVIFLPEAHLITAALARDEQSPVKIGSQSIFWEDTSPGGNFGAFTGSRTAKSMQALGCTHTIIGHCEERRRIAATLELAGIEDTSAVNKILNLKIKAAIDAGLKVLYCIGETEEEHGRWQEALVKQIEAGLDAINTDRIVIGYEPVWSIGPGKTPAGKDHITDTTRFIKQAAGGAGVVYGGGLKADNAAMLSSIEEIDGGLIALTRFTGDIGFYPDEYLEIVALYLGGAGVSEKQEGAV